MGRETWVCGLALPPFPKPVSGLPGLALVAFLPNPYLPACTRREKGWAETLDKWECFLAFP